MKTQITLLFSAMLLLTACGSSAQYANLHQEFEDGIYYNDSHKYDNLTAQNTDAENLVQETKNSRIFLKRGDTDTLIIPNNMSARLKFNKKNNYTDVTIYNYSNNYINNPYRYNPWYGIGHYSPYFYNRFYWDYDPYFYNSWAYNDWYDYYNPYYSYWYSDPWYSDIYYRHYAYYNPYYGGIYYPYYGYYANIYGPYYGGYYDPYYDYYGGYGYTIGTQVRQGERTSLGNNVTWTSRASISHSGVRNALGSYSSTIRRNNYRSNSGLPTNSRVSSESYSTRGNSYGRGNTRQSYRRVSRSSVTLDNNITYASYRSSGNTYSRSRSYGNNNSNNSYRRSYGYSNSRSGSAYSYYKPIYRRTYNTSSSGYSSSGYSSSRNSSSSNNSGYRRSYNSSNYSRSSYSSGSSYNSGSSSYSRSSYSGGGYSRSSGSSRSGGGAVRR